MNSMVVHELMYDEINFPDGYETDISKMGYVSRKYNIQPEKLKELIEKYIDIYGKTVLQSIWLSATKKLVDAKKYLVKNLNVLNTKLIGSSHKTHSVLVKQNDENKYLAYILIKRKDDKFGNSTGFPNEEYWDGTPGAYGLKSILNLQSNVLCIDGGSNWNVYGIDNLKQEIKEKYGYLFKVKKVSENLKGV